VSAALAVRGVSKRYGRLQALRDVSFELHAGELLAVIGPNGAGKTTLLSIIAGVQPASAGSVSRGPREVGWAPQQPALYRHLSVAENLSLFAQLEGLARPREAVERMLAQTGLRERADERAGRLSGGNRQRVNVALGLIGDPPVLALDEPSASLDPGQRERLWAFVAALAQNGTAVIFSTHNVAEAQRHAHRLLVLADGELVFEGAPSELLQQGEEPAGGDLERALVRFLGAREAGAREAGTREAGTREAGSGEAGSGEAPAREGDPREAARP
jgi:ABC-2 type transport system ATP-binding protein